MDKPGWLALWADDKPHPLSKFAQDLDPVLNPKKDRTDAQRYKDFAQFAVRDFLRLVAFISSLVTVDSRVAPLAGGDGGGSVPPCCRCHHPGRDCKGESQVRARDVAPTSCWEVLRRSWRRCAAAPERCSPPRDALIFGAVRTSDRPLRSLDPLMNAGTSVRGTAQRR